ncbi:MAG: orotidine-5'-phosphate decarboxylase [Spirochaetales bacterium]|nr:orotidine-5'-phosphate decarboxylase [Spirochaetales bacterium]
MEGFTTRFRSLRARRGNLLCVGLDPEPASLPGRYAGDVFAFVSDIIRSTRDKALAYKLNLAFFEMLDLDLARSVVRLIRSRSDSLIVADAKRGDIGNSAAAYARAVFEKLECDAITVSPYMGFESLEPFLSYDDRGTIVLCRTSNPGAAEFQLCGDPPLYAQVAREAAVWAERFPERIWLVVGATAARPELERIVQEAPHIPWLVPGVGAQGGQTEDLFAVRGAEFMVNVSRAILYADDPAAVAASYASQLAVR